MKIFKILDTKTGFYSTGGYTPSWTVDGKSYKTLAQVKAALKLYARGSTSWVISSTKKDIAAAKLAARRTVPTTWQVVEFELKPKRYSDARALV